MVYLPCLHVTGHIPFASGANINIPFRNDLRVPHLETVTTCAPVIYLARACTAPHRLLASGTNYWKLLPFLAAFASFASNVTASVTLAWFCCLQLVSACLSVLLSVPSSSLRCFACGGASCIWAISCSLFRFPSTLAAQTSAALCLPLLSSRLPRAPAGSSVVISVPFSCLRCFAFGSASFVWRLSCSLVRFRSAMASQTSAMARAFFSSAAFLATFTCVAATRCPLCWCFPREWGESSNCYRLGHHCERCLLYVAYAASRPAPCLFRTSQAHSAAVACPFPHGGRKIHFVLARIADATELCLFARRTNTIKCGLFCLECIFLFPGRACHALPRLLGVNVLTHAFFASSRRLCAFPSNHFSGRKPLLSQCCSLPFACVCLHSPLLLGRSSLRFASLQSVIQTLKTPKTLQIPRAAPKPSLSLCLPPSFSLSPSPYRTHQIGRVGGTRALAHSI